MTFSIQVFVKNEIKYPGISEIDAVSAGPFCLRSKTWVVKRLPRYADGKSWTSLRMVD